MCIIRPDRDEMMALPPGGRVGASSRNARNAGVEYCQSDCRDNRAMPTEAPRVFISFSHDSPAHRDKVLAFADRLRADGIDAQLDQYTQFPPEGWNAHCARQIRRADCVLIVCTEIYRRRWDGEEEPGRGNGVRSEANLIRNYFYEAGSESRKFVPILFAGTTEAHIPGELVGL